jgi:CRISPR type III-A-associated protein Csm2
MNTGRPQNTPQLPKLETRVADILLMKSLTDDKIATLLDDIRDYARDYGKKLNTSQLRNVFSKVLKAEKVIDLQLIRPKLMYVAARQQDRDAKRIIEFFEKIITHIKDSDTVGVKNYKTFMEAFVAYHKYLSI